MLTCQQTTPASKDPGTRQRSSKNTPTLTHHLEDQSHLSGT